jgi:hypothetical protein
LRQAEKRQGVSVNVDLIISIVVSIEI